MEKSFRFNLNKGENTDGRWFTDTIFTIHERDQKVDLSDGDYDSGAGDLDEWVFVDYATIPEVNRLFDSRYGDVSEYILTEDQKAFYVSITDLDVRRLFLHLSRYLETEQGSMRTFRKLLDDNKIENKYSAYRSSGD